MAGTFEIMTRVLTEPSERQGFFEAYSPVLNSLIEARRLYRQKQGKSGSLGAPGGSTVSATSVEALIDTALGAMPKVFDFFALPVGFLLEADAGFNDGIALLYAHDPVVATYLLGCRSYWLKRWIETHQLSMSDGTAADATEIMDTVFGRVCAFVENICIHLFSKRLPKSLTIVEIQKTRRDPTFQKRFDVVLATSNTVSWILEYRSSGFADQ
jgi:hypothetical protein